MITSVKPKLNRSGTRRKTIWNFICELFRDKTPDRIVSKFRERFPGRCLICSFHNYGVREFFIKTPLPAHDCIEGKKKGAA